MSIVEMEPVHVLDEKMRERVLECGRRIRQNKGPLRKICMEIGFDGAFIESHAAEGSWGVLGYKDQHAFRIGEGIGRSNWYRHVGIASKFLKIDREAYLAMSIENAERLSLEPEEVRFDQEILQAAADMKAVQFDDMLTTKGAHREGKPVREKWVEMKLRLRDTQRKVIYAGIEEWKTEHGIDDDAYALELLVAEYKDRPTLVGFMLESVPKLTDAIRDTDDLSELKLLLASHIQAIGGILKQCCGDDEEAVA